MNGTTYQFTATETDATSNTSVLSASYAATIDTIAPNAPSNLHFVSGSTVGWNAATDNSGGSGIDHYLYQVDTGTQTNPTGSYTSTTSTTGTWTNPVGTQAWTLFVESVDVAGNVSNASRLTFNAPAGVAGEPINLALTDPSGVGALTTVTISGMPADWSLNKGTNNGNGTWTMETDDLSALTVLTAAAYAGATVLSVTETWANADGTTGTAVVLDNVEAYVPGSPIFALSGDDNLTGSGANDLFVFAQPIGNDVIYNFDAASDKIDLMGFAGVASFSDLHIADNANGDAVITVGNGETITLHGVDAASLTANDFVFNQTPVVENAGTMVIGDGAVLPLGGTIDNSGTIELNSSGDYTELQIIGDGITLQGGGHVTMSGDAAIVGATSSQHADERRQYYLRRGPDRLRRRQPDAGQCGARHDRGRYLWRHAYARHRPRHRQRRHIGSDERRHAADRRCGERRQRDHRRRNADIRRAIERERHVR